MSNPFDVDPALTAHRGGIYTGNNGTAPHYARHPSINTIALPSPPSALPEFDRFLMKDPVTGGPVLLITSNFPPQSFGYYLDGTLYPGNVADLIAPDDWDMQAISQLMCDSGTTFVRYSQTRNGLPTGTFVDLDVAGGAYSPVGAVTIGACAILRITKIFAQEWNAGDVFSIADIVAALPAGASIVSLSVAQKSGNTTISGDSGSAYKFEAGSSTSWAVTNDNIGGEDLNASTLNFKVNAGTINATALYLE
jgi:hypothetical protein